MRKSVLASLLLVALTVFSAGTEAQSYLGTWTGTWEGMGSSGGFELTLEKGNESPTGKVTVTGEPAYSAAIKTLKIDSNKLTASYDFPPDPSLEVLLAAAFEGDTLKGTWVARTKADSGEVASGTWTLKKK
jgi:hypothetical protein